MKKAAFYILSLCALIACNNNNAFLGDDSNVIDYQIEDNEYAVVIVQEEGMSNADAKKQALKKAAQMTKAHHFRYFLVEKEEHVQAISRNSSSSNSQMPSNTYYQLIQGGSYGSSQYEAHQFSVEEAYPAYRITFTCYAEKPSNKAIDACTLIDCK
jgi:hypothetical protein